MTSLNYRHVLCIVLGVLIVPLYLAACVLSILKAHRDRKAIKARNEARRLAHPLTTSSSSNPVDIIANEVRANRWHRRHSSITSAKVQSLLNVINSQNKAEEERNIYRHPEDQGERKKPTLGDLHAQRSRDNLLPAKQQDEDKTIHKYAREIVDRGRDKNFSDSLHRLSPTDLSLRGKNRRKEHKENGVVEELNVAENATKHRLESRRGIDNPAVHLKDESPYCYDSSEEWVRTDSGALEMVSMGNRDPLKHHHQLQSQHLTPESGHQRYIFHPARSSREDLTDFSLSGKMNAARLARFDSYDSSEFTSAQDLRASKQTSRPQQKPPRQHQNQQHHQQQRQLQQRQQRSRRDLDNGYEPKRHEKNMRHHDQSHHHNEEIDLSPSKLLSSVSSRNRDAKYALTFGEEGTYLSQRDRQRDIDLWLGAGRRNSYASALDRNEADLYFAASRSLSVADLSSSKNASNPRNDRFRNDSHSTKHYGRINNAFSQSMDRGSFDEF